jgi:hypothetical protein
MRKKAIENCYKLEESNSLIKTKTTDSVEQVRLLQRGPLLCPVLAVLPFGTEA